MSLRPDPDASALADEMAAMDDVMYEILDETIPEEKGAEVTESGRTLCSDGDLRGPLARFPSAVELASCARGTKGGTWHTHVTKEQLRDPANSLPDTANAIFGEMDVSAVVGTRSMEMVVAPADEDAGKEAFRDALGADVRSTDDVVDAIMEGDVSDPADARDRVRRRMRRLFRRERLNFGELDGRLDMSSIPARSPMHFEQVEAMHYSTLFGQEPQTSRSCARVRSRARENAEQTKETLKSANAGSAAVSTAVSVVVARAMRGFL